MTHYTDQLSRVIAVFNGKGGVGKTSTVANVAGHLSSAYKVLVIDLDTQGNLGLNFGYRGSDDDDQGMRIVRALQEEEPFEPPVSARENIDAYPGGRKLKLLPALEHSDVLEDGTAVTFAKNLAEIADDYDFILLDCPPGNVTLQQMALAAARYVLIPIDTDPASWDGITEVGPMVTKARKTNPNLTFLGAAIFGHPAGATRLLKNTKVKLDSISDRLPMFETSIRYSKAAAHDCRTRGQLIHELAGDVTENRAQALAALRESPNDRPTVERLAGTAADLSQDYRDMTREILQRIVAHEETTPIAKAGR